MSDKVTLDEDGNWESISYVKYLECPKYETIELCPICGSEQKEQSEWPQSGTHVFTIPYECGTELDYPIGHEGATFGVTCDGNVKRYVMPEITDEIRERFIQEFLGKK